MASALIRANRLEISDKFPVLGFTVRTGGAPYFEAVLATDPALFASTARERRTADTFWSSRTQGPLPAERGEAVFIVPDEVLRRFSGESRLYYAVATFTDRTRKNPEVVLVKPDAAPYIALAGNYSGRPLRQLIGVRGPGRRWNGASYGAPEAHGSLEWAGDEARPGMDEAPGASAGTESAREKTGNGNGHASAAQAYDDGYGDELWTAPAPSDSTPKVNVAWPDIPLPPRLAGVPDWLAPAAQLISWRDQPVADPLQPMQSLVSLAPTGAGIVVTAELLKGIAAALGFDVDAVSSFDVSALAKLLDTRGPQWLVLPGLQPRAMLVTAVVGDGTPAGTNVRISDPSPQAPSAGTGGARDLTFQQLMDTLPASGAGSGLHALHVTEADMQTRPRLVTAQAVAQRSTSMRSQNAKRAPARQQAAPVVIPIVSTILGATMTRIMNNSGDVSWELDQLRGLKVPGDDNARRGSETYRTITTAVKEWPVVEVGFGVTDEIYADFEMEWQCNGHSVGNLTIKNTHTNDAVGWGLTIDAKINDDSTVYQGDVAAIRVAFQYRFSGPPLRSDALAIRDFTLFGDGTIKENSRWTQAPDGFTSTEQRLSRGQGGAAAVIAEVAGPITETLLKKIDEWADDDINLVLPQLDGWKHVRDDVSTQRAGNEQVKTVTVTGPWMEVDRLVDTDKITVDLQVTWSYDGSSVGNIRIRPKNANDATGAALKVTGEVYNTTQTKPTADGGTCAAIRLLFNYHFTFTIGSPEDTNFDVLLYGDGTHDVVRL
jgi:hypothetical protein